jgi:MarR family transcriptional regulator, organic hydroperoxide resistance regulator
MTGMAPPRDAYDELRLDNQLCFGLYAAANAIVRAYRPFLAALGVTYPQYLVLMALWERDRQTVSELGRELKLDSGTLTPLLKRMEAAGLVARRRRARDEREVEIGLTEQGRRLRDPGLGVRREVVCLLGMSQSDIVRLRNELNAVINALHACGPHADGPEKAAAAPTR